MTTATATVKLITILCGSELEGRLAADLKTLGATRYTMTHASGRGVHGERKLGIIDGGNARIELLVSADLAEKIIELLSTSYDGEGLTAFMHDVEALPRSHFIA